MAYTEQYKPGLVKGTFDSTVSTSSGIVTDEGDKLLFIGVGTGWTGTVQIRVLCDGLDGKYGADITADSLQVLELPANCKVRVICSVFSAGTYSYVLKR